jgi:hypothetical protein
MGEPITYERRRPEATTLYQVVQDNLETMRRLRGDAPRGVRLQGARLLPVVPRPEDERDGANLVDYVMPKVPLRQWASAAPLL